MIWSFLTVPFEVYEFVALEDCGTLAASLLLEGGNGDGEVATLDGYSGDVSPGDICCNGK
jgi:hypothetical protein